MLRASVIVMKTPCPSWGGSCWKHASGMGWWEPVTERLGIGPPPAAPTRGEEKCEVAPC